MSRVVVLTATNRIDMVYPALKRAGPFDKLLYIPQPDMNARRQILEIQTKGKRIGLDISLGRVAEITNGVSAANITVVVSTAILLVLQEYIAMYPKPEDAKQHVAKRL